MDLLGNEKRPLAERIRPAKLDDFVGQAHVISRLTNMLAAPRLPSLLLFGPPGCGKSTLALILARAKGRPYVRVSAPEAGLAALRELIKGKVFDFSGDSWIENTTKILRYIEPPTQQVEVNDIKGVFMSKDFEPDEG